LVVLMGVAPGAAKRRTAFKAKWWGRTMTPAGEVVNMHIAYAAGHSTEP
jgi:hypothetical protein